MVRRVACLLCLVLSVVLGFSSVILAEVPATVEMPESLPKLEESIVATTMGQSPGALMVRMLCTSLGLKGQDLPLITADDLEKGAKDPSVGYSTLFVTMGTSLKGMGAAGINLNEEVARVTALVAKAKDLGIFVIATQIEGPARRVDESDETSNRTVAPLADLIVVRKDVDWDGYFAGVAKENGVPIVYVTQALDLKYVLQVLFGK